MTEKEKMLAGQPYNSRDPALLALYLRARALLKAAQEVPPADFAGRVAALRQLFGALGDGSWIEPPFHCDYGENIRIGSDCFVNANCVFLDCNRITIGDGVLIGPAVQLYTPTHPLNAAERLPAATPPARPRYVTSAQPIAIGEGCWIGGGAIVMPGVTIGARTTIGAGSVVTRPIPADCLALGNPCRVVRRLD